MEPADCEEESNARYEFASYIKKCCESLGLQCCCPYSINDTTDGIVVFVGYLPQFFSPRGVLIDLANLGPAGRKRRAAIAKRLEIPISFFNSLNPIKDNSTLIDALLDWGFYGNVTDLREYVAVLLLRPSPYI